MVSSWRDLVNGKVLFANSSKIIIGTAYGKIEINPCVNTEDEVYAYLRFEPARDTRYDRPRRDYRNHNDNNGEFEDIPNREDEDENV